VITTEPEILGPEIDVFDDEAETINSDINGLLTSIKNHELSLASNYVKLGRLLLRVQQERYWEGWGHSSFGQYIDSLRDYLDRARSQIYAFVAVADKLLPYVREQDLDSMGISRAQELARFVKQSGLKVPQHLLEAALDSKVKIGQLKIQVSEALHIKGEIQGTWWDPFGGGAYFTPDEKKEVQQAQELARRDIQTDLPDHQQRKEIILAWAREFYSSNVQEG